MSFVDRLRAMPVEELLAFAHKCAGSQKVAAKIVDAAPFADGEAALRAVDEAWALADRDDVLEAATHHPRIGADVAKLREKYATASWSSDEQKGASGASEETLLALRDANAAYEARFGFLFLVCATGRTADEMLALCRARLSNPVEGEWRVAREELRKITRIRLEKA